VTERTFATAAWTGRARGCATGDSDNCFELADQAGFVRQEHLAGGDVGLGKPGVACLHPPRALAFVEDSQLVVRRLRAVRRGDCVPATERADWNTTELHLGVFRETVHHRPPLPAADALVEPIDML
jgi:hypothetical protein